MQAKKIEKIPCTIKAKVGEEDKLFGSVTTQDIADAVAFLCSPKSSWITGEVLDLNGGAHLKRYPNIYEHIMKLAGQPPN